MIALLLTVLKVIGIVLLVILGLLITLILIVLLVPIRYKGTAVYHGKPEGNGVITWFFHLLRISFCYKDVLSYKVRVFGRVLVSSDSADESDLEEELFSDEPISEPVAEETVADRKMLPKADETSGEATPKPDEIRKSSQEVDSEISNVESAAENTKKEADKNARKKKPGFLRWLKYQIRRWIRRVTDFISDIQNRIEEIQRKYRKIKRILEDENNRKTAKLLLRQIRYLIGHIIPQKSDGYVTFGFEDPELTAKVLEGCAFFYPLYRGCVSIEPVFGENVLDGEINMKGRIRIGTVLAIALRMLFDRNFRKWMKRLMHRSKV